MPYIYQDKSGKVIKKSEFHRRKVKEAKDGDRARYHNEQADLAEDWENAAAGKAKKRK